MANPKVWELKYVVGNPKLYTKITTASGGPFKRSEALEDAEKIAANGWRVWVEHSTTGKRIFESDIEKQFASKIEV